MNLLLLCNHILQHNLLNRCFEYLILNLRIFQQDMGYHKDIEFQEDNNVHMHNLKQRLDQ